MSKYNGIKIVQSNVNSVNEVTPKAVVEKNEESGGGFFSGLLMRIVLAALVLVSLFTLKNIDNPLAVKTLDTVKSVVAFDMNNRPEEDIGEVKFLELVKELLSTK